MSVGSRDEPEADDLRTSIRGRWVLLTRRDEAILSEALRSVFPSMVVMDHDQWFDPKPAVRASLAECQQSGAVEVPYSRDWRPVAVPNGTVSGWYRLANPCVRRLRYAPSRWLWKAAYTSRDDARFAFDFPTLQSGTVAAFWDEEDPQEEGGAFQQVVWRLLARVTTSRLKTGTPLSNELMRGSDRLLMAEADRQDVWAGHHALEWCAAGGSRRMLDGCFRPCDDWAPPTDRWYVTLRRKVEARYGPDFGDPPAEPPE
jgi:hypothetical protein